MKKIKVLHFTIANSGGGITKYALRIWNHINKDEFQCDYATMSKKLDFAGELEEQGCKIHYISTYSEVDSAKFEAEIDRILDEGYDVLHLHTGWWRGFNIENIAKKKKVPKVIVNAHNTEIHIPIGMTRDEARQLHYSWQRRVTPDIATDFWACAQNAANWLFGDNIPDELIKIINSKIENNTEVNSKLEAEAEKLADSYDRMLDNLFFKRIDDYKQLERQYFELFPILQNQKKTIMKTSKREELLGDKNTVEGVLYENDFIIKKR